MPDLKTFPWGEVTNIITLPSGNKVYKYHPFILKTKKVYKYYPVILDENEIPKVDPSVIKFHVPFSDNFWNGVAHNSMDQAIVGDILNRNRKRSSVKPGELNKVFIDLGIEDE